jgi:Tfp pilus assembly protein PilO
MSTISRGIVYTLIAAVLVLLLGITALLSVAYNRHRRLEDVTTDLQRNLTQQEHKIVELEEKLEDCDTLQAVAPVDHSWDTQPSSAQSGKKPAQTASPTGNW